ncbi:conserved hypothetical protein [Rubrivivax sp. A210]|uniref:hypothetical protein n=1 Tax=Rubrivivax sp. A210 TaxID=2772301 RepID=UPI0019182B72|nr:hypothetical protein [Rubrivivax sp. A210]CAD5372869.1 conserved hypothetical protein [Rubrivivax sp. A210]
MGIQVNGRVQYMPGPWGMAVAAAGAQVEVIDVDPGGTDDVIWSGRTGADGRFSGTSSEWRDNKNLRIWVVSGWPPRGRWVDQSVPDPTDVLLLKLRVRANNRTHEIFPFANTAPLPVILPWGPPYLAKSARALLVVNNTVEMGQARYRALYQFLEASGDAVARSICGPHYQTVRSLNGSAATLQAFLDALRDLAQAPGIQGVDTIVNMHGADGSLLFAGSGSAGVAVANLASGLAGLKLAGKLRLLYNTSCYGHSHAPAFLQGGFNTVIGGRRVVCNSASEYPLLLSNWVAGLGVEAALAPAQAAPLRDPMDQFARSVLGFTDADSFKLVSGNGALTIGALAT